jgi:hypothetical protein
MPYKGRLSNDSEKSHEVRTGTDAHGRFVQALQHEHLTCAKPGCGVYAHHRPHTSARIKTSRPSANGVIQRSRSPERNRQRHHGTSARSR